MLCHFAHFGVLLYRLLFWLMLISCAPPETQPRRLGLARGRVVGAAQHAAGDAFDGANQVGLLAQLRCDYGWSIVFAAAAVGSFFAADHHETVSFHELQRGRRLFVREQEGGCHNLG